MAVKASAGRIDAKTFNDRKQLFFNSLKGLRKYDEGDIFTAFTAILAGQTVNVKELIASISFFDLD